MVDNKRTLAAPCGLYCGACILYRAHKNKDFELLEQLKGQYAELLSGAEEGQIPPGILPPTKNPELDLARVKREIQQETCMHCNGCLSDVLALPCRICGFRQCTKEKGITTCAECPDMPCQWVNDHTNDGIPHHGECLSNLKRQKEIGIDAWLSEQEERWCCVQCKRPLSWYDAECPDCHATLNQTFGTLPF